MVLRAFENYRNVQTAPYLSVNAHGKLRRGDRTGRPAAGRTRTVPTPPRSNPARGEGAESRRDHRSTAPGGPPRSSVGSAPRKGPCTLFHSICRSRDLYRRRDTGRSTRVPSLRDAPNARTWLPRAHKWLPRAAGGRNRSRGVGFRGRSTAWGHLGLLD